MKPLRRSIVLGALVLGACESPAAPDLAPAPSADLVGGPCSVASTDCRHVTAHQVAANFYRLWSQPGHVGPIVYICDVNRATIDAAHLNTYWRCDWQLLPAP